jgi:hypothetical protein
MPNQSILVIFYTHDRSAIDISDLIAEPLSPKEVTKASDQYHQAVESGLMMLKGPDPWDEARDDLIGGMFANPNQWFDAGRHPQSGQYIFPPILRRPGLRGTEVPGLRRQALQAVSLDN